MMAVRNSSATTPLPAFPRLVMPLCWEDVADSIAYDSPSLPPPVTLVCGPGNSGKSTFGRHLLNTLLKRYKRVGYLDTDVGQTEFTPPGCLSLHIIDRPAPDLTVLCLKTPKRCFFYGGVCANDNPGAYLDCILRLYDYFHAEYYQTSDVDDLNKPMLPLVVNTSGWVKGSGYNVLVEIIRHIAPTHVVQIRVSAEKKNLPPGNFWSEGPSKRQVNSIEIPAWKDSFQKAVSIQKEARIMRELRIIAYFRQCLPRDLDISSYNELVDCLANVPPYEVQLSKFKVTHLQDSNAAEACDAINSTILGLAIYAGAPSECENRKPWCIGLGFVRAVDTGKDQLYLITPVCQEDIIRKVNVLVRGSIEIPTCLLQLHGRLSPCSKLKPLESDVKIAE